MTDTGKAAILGRVRKALGRADEAEPEIVRTRLQQPRPNTIPARSRLQQPQLTDLFVQMAEQSQATVQRLQSLGDVPAALADWCRGQGFPGHCVLGPASELANLDWGAAGMQTEHRPAVSGDPLAVASAWAGLAETGTLVLRSGPANPVTSNFLPEYQAVVLREPDVLGAAEDLWTRLRDCGEAMPRTLNWITGPSRSGDIEMTMVNGAHGPIGVHILLIP